MSAADARSSLSGSLVSQESIAKSIAARIATESGKKTAPALYAALRKPLAFKRSGRSLGGGGSPPRGVVALHHGAAARTDLRAVPDHAGGDSLDVGDFMAA